MTKLEWLELAKTNLLDYSPQNLVAVKCINEVIELEKGGKDNNPNYHASICSSCSPITEKPCHPKLVSLFWATMSLTTFTLPVVGDGVNLVLYSY